MPLEEEQGNKQAVTWRTQRLREYRLWTAGTDTRGEWGGSPPLHHPVTRPR